MEFLLATYSGVSSDTSVEGDIKKDDVETFKDSQALTVHKSLN